MIKNLKLKDKNDVIQLLLEDSLGELSRVFSETNGVVAQFSYWSNTKFLDNDKNHCMRGVMDFAILNPKDGKVVSFKLLIDRVLVLRKNEGTKEKPKYGKQLGYEELRRTILHDILGKAIGGLAFGLQEKTKEDIEEFNRTIGLDENSENSVEELEITPELIEEFSKVYKEEDEVLTDKEVS